MTLATVKLFSNNTLVQKFTSIDIRYAVPTLSSDGEIIYMQKFQYSIVSEVSPSLVFECTLMIDRMCEGCVGSSFIPTIAYWVGPSISYFLNNPQPFAGGVVGIKSTNINYV